MRSRTENCGELERTVCCEKKEETFASKDLAPNKRELLPTSRCGTKSKTLEHENLKPKNTNFVSECSQTFRKAPNHRYVFRSLQMSAKSGTVNFSPSSIEIPLVEAQIKPINEQIQVKPLLTASKRPQTSVR